MKSYALAFSLFDLAVLRSVSTKCHHFNTHGSTQVPNATYHVSRPSVSWLRRKILMIFPIHGHGGHTGHVTFVGD